MEKAEDGGMREIYGGSLNATHGPRVGEMENQSGIPEGEGRRPGYAHRPRGLD